MTTGAAVGLVEMEELAVPRVSGRLNVRAGTVVTTGVTAEVIGDSLSAGFFNGPGIDVYRAYPTIVGAELGWRIRNRAVSSSQAQDAGQCDVVLARTITETSTTFGLFGYNNMREGGTDATKREVLKGTVYAMALWGAILHEKKQTAAHPDVVFTGSWVFAPSAYGGSMVKVTSTIGDTAVANVYCSTAYVWMVRIAGGGGTFAVYVDGVLRETGTCAGGTTSPSGRNFSPFVVRIPDLSPGPHTILVTPTSASQVFVLGFAGNLGANTLTGPTFYLGDCLRMSAAGYLAGGATYSAGSDAAVTAINKDFIAISRELCSDGLNVPYVDASSYVDPEIHADTDDVHLNTLGQRAVAVPFIKAMAATASAHQQEAWRRPKSKIPDAVACTANTAITLGTAVDITGATTTFTPDSDGTIEAKAFFDVQQTSDPATPTNGPFVGLITINGVAQSGRAAFNPKVLDARHSVGCTGTKKLTANTTYTIKLQALQAGNATFTVFQTNTVLSFVFTPK